MRSRPIGITLALALALAVTAARATAQTTPPPQTPAPPQTTQPAQSTVDEQPSWIVRLREPDQAGGLHFTEHWGVVFGGIKQGSGIALGPAWSTKFGDGSFVQLK